MSSRLIIKDAMWQIIGRVASAVGGFFVVKIIAPYLGPLRYGDYSTIMKYFAIWTALADLGLYVISVKRLGVLRSQNIDLRQEFGKLVGARFVTMAVVYLLAILVVYLFPSYYGGSWHMGLESYTSNIYLLWGLPLGMLFSASFMFAGILQLPLQVFWKMEKLSLALVFARVSQIALLVVSVYFIFDNIVFDGSRRSLIAFLIVMFSVVLSGVVQGIYVWHKSQKILPLKVVFERKYIWDTVVSNWKYGVSYFLSSFHTLIVLIILSNLFPSFEGFNYAGMRALALSLIEMLLIVPSAMGNSMLHNVAGYNIKNKLKSFGNFLTLVYWIGALFFVNFYLFSDQIILIISGKEYFSTSWLYPGSNLILPFLAIVLWLSFIKQVFNYLLVATEKHNLLLWINSIGVAIGVALGAYFIPTYNIVGGIITQIVLEVAFVVGIIFVAYKHSIFPKISFKNIAIISIGTAIITLIGASLMRLVPNLNVFLYIPLILVFNIIIAWVSIPFVKKFARGLAVNTEDNLDI